MKIAALLAALLAGGCVGGPEAAVLTPSAERALDNAAAMMDAHDPGASADYEVAAAEAAAVVEATAFMASYARDLGAGDRAAIAARYHRGGAWRVGNGEKSFEPWPAIRDYYSGPDWSPPASFGWRELEYQPLGADAVVVVGLFDWGPGGGRAPVTVSYTGLLVREDGVLRIRVEDESAARRAAAN